MPDGNKADSTGRRWGFRFVALSISTLVSLLGLWLFHDYWANKPIYLQEPGYERTGHRYLYDSTLGWRNIPNWEASTNGRRLTINSKGLRDFEYSYAKPSGVRRILVLGDSFAWGYGVADDEIFTEVIEERLARDSLLRGEKYEVVNTGVSGWGTDQEYLFLQREGFNYSPDIVVLAFFIVNDFENNESSIVYGLQKPVFANEELDLANVPVPGPSAPKRTIRTQANSFDLTLSIITHMRDACTKQRCRLVIMKFGRYIPRWKDNAELLSNERRLRGAAQRLNIAYLDLDDAFDANEVTADELLWGNDDGHWNAQGHRLAAGFLYEFLVESQLITN
jgi:lysophospholipase L1-like esterase